MVATRITTKKIALYIHWIPTNSPQLVHRTSVRISLETDTDSSEQPGHLLFKDIAPQLFSIDRFGSVAAILPQTGQLAPYGQYQPFKSPMQ
jgi:hypothetical protein